MPDGGVDRAFKIAEALGDVSGPGPNGDYLCRCPAHPDETPSLSIKEDGDSGLLVHCFAGCTSPAIFAALARRGLWTPPEVAPAEPKSAAPEAGLDEAGEDEPLEEHHAEDDPAETATKAAVEARAKKLAEARAKFAKGWAAFSAQSALHATVDTYCDWRGVTRFATAPEWARFTTHGSHVGKDKDGSRFEQFFPMLLIAGVHPTTGEPLGGQREYLAYGGRGPAPIDKKERKKTAPGCSLKGAVARMAEPKDGEFLVVGEGWTTVRTVMDATGLPGWSVFGASGIAAFDPPDSIKSILFLAENDENGHNAKALAAVCPRLFERGIKLAVAAPPPGLNDFNDLVRMRDDGTRLHGTVEAGLTVVRGIIDTAKARATSKAETSTAPTGAAPPPIDLPGFGADEDKKFVMTPTGLYRGKMFICAPFEVVAHTHAIVDGEADDWGLQLRFRNKKGATIEKFIPAEIMYGEPSAVAASLATAGMEVVVNTAAAKGALAAYLSLAEAKAFTIVTKRTGWVEVAGERVFVLPNQALGAKSVHVALAGGRKGVVAYRQAGTLAEWQEHIGKPAGDHILMQFGIAIGWAGVLLQMAGGESGGFHFWEVSTRGKTTVQQVSASLWGRGTLTGGFIQRWRSTANNLEATFAAASDTCLILEELRQAAHGEVATIVYTLTGEVGKGRLRADATARTPFSWRVLLLSSGEVPIVARLNEDRYQRDGRSKELLGGATVRVIDIPADRKFGAFDQPPDNPDFNPAAFAEQMQEMAATYYGTAGPAFVTALIEEKVDDEKVRHAVDEFVVSVLEAGAEGQLRRVARRFGLVATAGMMAIGAGIVDWDPDRFIEGVRGLFHAWAKARGARPIEETRILTFARTLWAKYGRLRFECVGADLDHDRVVNERWGFRRDEPDGEKWLMFPSVFDEQFASVGARKAVEVLSSHGILEKGTEKDRWTRRVQLSGMKQQSFYVINEKIFEGSDEAPEATETRPGKSKSSGKAGKAGKVK